MDKYTHCRGVQSSAKLGEIPRRKSRWGNSCGRGLVDLKGPKGGVSDGLFETDIYVLRGFSPQQKYTSSDHSLTCAQLIIRMRLRKAEVRYPEAC